MSKEKRYIGIMVTTRERRKSTLKKYLPYCPSGYTLFTFTPKSINWEKRRITGMHETSQGFEIGKFPFPKAVYNRCYEEQDSVIERLEKAIGKGKCFNHRNRFNKLQLYRYLRDEFAAHLPATMAYEEKAAAEMLETYPVLYFKPCQGFMGNGVIRAARQPNGEIHIGDHYFVPELIVTSIKDFQKAISRRIGSKPYLMQAEIPIGQVDGKIFDIRVLVQKNGKGNWAITNVVSRIASPGSFNTSMCDAVRKTEDLLKELYPSDQAEEIMQSVRKIGLGAASLIEKKTKRHLGELSVDLALDSQRKLWMIELNGKPQKNLYEELEDNTVFQRPLDYARYLSG